MINFDDAVNYILMLKEEAMKNKDDISKENVLLNKKVIINMQNNQKIKEKIEKMYNAGSISEMQMIWYGIEKKDINKPTIKDNEEEVKEILNEQNNYIPDVEGGTNKQKVLVRNGFIDTLLVSLSIGFVAGMLLSIVILIMS